MREKRNCSAMDEEKLNKPTSRKSSKAESGKGENITDGGEIQLKAKMSLLNGITVIVGSIIGESLFNLKVIQKSIYHKIKSQVLIIKS